MSNAAAGPAPVAYSNHEDLLLALLALMQQATPIPRTLRSILTRISHAEATNAATTRHYQHALQISQAHRDGLEKEQENLCRVVREKKNNLAIVRDRLQELKEEAKKTSQDMKQARMENANLDLSVKVGRRELMGHRLDVETLHLGLSRLLGVEMLPSGVRVHASTEVVDIPVAVTDATQSVPFDTCEAVWGKIC